MFYQIELKAANGFVDFLLIIPPFVKESDRSGAFSEHPWSTIVEQLAQIGERTRRNRVATRDFGGRCLDSNRMNGTPGSGFPQRNAQECGLLVITLHQMDPSALCLREANRRNDPGKSAAASEVDPGLRPRGELVKLETIEDMAPP
ncbi:hypothetical protein JOH52_001306 [Sinorhizobium meliloti]|nr:hypothetical protein [Sinorhizobium meliloti]